MTGWDARTTDTTLPDGIMMHSDRATQSQQYSHTVRQASAEAAVLLHRDAEQVLRIERNPKPYRTNGRSSGL